MGRSHGVSALFDSCRYKAVQITAQAVTGRFRCLIVMAPVLADSMAMAKTMAMCRPMIALCNILKDAAAHPVEP